MTGNNGSNGFPMIFAGGAMIFFPQILEIMTLLLPSDGSSGMPLSFLVDNVLPVFQIVGILAIVYGVFSIYRDAAGSDDNQQQTNAESSFSGILQTSSETITRYLERPGIAVDHPLRALPQVLSELAILEDDIPSKQRSLVTLTATKIAESVNDDKSWNTQGPRPEITGDVVSKLATLRDDLKQADREQVDQTLSVLSRQLTRL